MSAKPISAVQTKRASRKVAINGGEAAAGAAGAGLGALLGSAYGGVARDSGMPVSDTAATTAGAGIGAGVGLGAAALLKHLMLKKQTKRASRKTAMDTGDVALAGLGAGAAGAAGLAGGGALGAILGAMKDSDRSEGTGGKLLRGAATGAATGLGAGIGGGLGGAAAGTPGAVLGATAGGILAHLLARRKAKYYAPEAAVRTRPKTASDYCPPGVIKAEPATNMTKMPPTNVKTTTVKTAARPSILTRIGKIPGKLYDAAGPLLNKTVGRTDLGNELLETMERNPGKTKLLAATGLAGTGTLAATGRLHPVNATEALFAGAPPKPTGLAQILDQAKDKAQGLLSGAKDFAGGFAQSPMKWDTAHALTAGGVALGGAALLAHLLRKKRTPAEEQELAEA